MQEWNYPLVNIMVFDGDFMHFLPDQFIISVSLATMLLHKAMHFIDKKKWWNVKNTIVTTAPRGLNHAAPNHFFIQYMHISWSQMDI